MTEITTAPADWMPVASQAVGVLGQATERVQIVATICLTVIVLAAIGAWLIKNRPPIVPENMVPSDLLINVTNELSQQINTLRSSMDAMAAALVSAMAHLEEKK